MTDLGVSLVEGHWSEGSDADLVAAIDRWSAQTGHRPSHVAVWKTLTFLPLTPRANGFPSRRLLEDLEQRRITPVVFLESRVTTDSTPEIDTFLDASWAGDILIRKDQEMNGRWAPWSKVLTPTAYVREWRDDTRAIRAAYPGARMFWCPSLLTPDHFRTMAAYWPGAASVDVMGFDRYDLGGRKPLDEAWAKPVTALRALPGARALPVGVGEWGLSAGDGRIPVIRSVQRAKGVRFALYFDIDRSVHERDPKRDWTLTPRQRQVYGAQM